VRKGGIALLTKRDEGGRGRPLDDLAVGLDTGVITRGRAIKLAGAALVASALAAIGATDAEAIEAEGQRKKRRRCNQDGGEFCASHSGRRNCDVCCGRGDRNRQPKACCGKNGCSCCGRRQRCHNGDCRRN
jgi:hypothetical protein